MAKAASADAAANATSADTAANANALGGKPASAFVTDVEVVSESTGNSSDPTRNVTATCPAGKVVIGGGGGVTFGGSEAVALAYSAPPQGPGSDTSWHASAYEIAPTAQVWGLEAVAYCAAIGG